MRATRLRIENYKGLRNIVIPLSRFCCLIGENNTGKSSVLSAVSLFFSGSSLPKTHYFDTAKSIRIEISFADITEGDLERLAEEHRTRVRAIISKGTLTLVRTYGGDGKSSLKYRRLLPKEERFSDDSVDALVKGKKAGRQFVE